MEDPAEPHDLLEAWLAWRADDGLLLEVGENFDDEVVRRLVPVLASC